MTAHILSVLAFMAISFAVQGTSHFVLNKAHYDAISIMRAEAIIPLGLLTMVVQGVILSLALQLWKGSDVSLKDGLIVALGFGLFLGVYIAVTEAAKYDVPSIADWMRVEALASTIQFTVFGLALGFIHKAFSQ